MGVKMENRFLKNKSPFISFKKFVSQTVEEGRGDFHSSIY